MVDQAKVATAIQNRQDIGGLLPDPEPRERFYTVVSVDDHVIEPPHMFASHLASRFKDKAPRVIETADGAESWQWEGLVYPQIATGAAAGRPKERWGLEATRFSEIRRGGFDIEARIKDMDIDGVAAQLNFPSLISGMGGATFYKGTKDAELGQACMRAWNDWFYEEWYSPYPDRTIPCGITWIGDTAVAAAEVRRNAARGFKALSFPSSPTELGLPSLSSGYWDPLLAACEETETVLCLHVGSDDYNLAPPKSSFQVGVTCFPMGAYRAAADWLWSGVLTRYPNLKIVLAEGGIAWVPMLKDRLNYMMDHAAAAPGEEWMDKHKHPVEVLENNFYFCAIEFSSGMEQRHKIGIDRIMVETDYPHADSSWPDTQALLHAALKDLPKDEVRKVTYENACRVFRHPVPQLVKPARAA